MGGVTPVFGFPYPTGADRVADGDNAIQALATALDTAMAAAKTAQDPGAAWTDLALLNGWFTGVAPAGPVAYRKDALANVWILGTLQHANNTGQVVAVLPVGSRPAMTAGWQVPGLPGAWLQVATDGTMTFSGGGLINASVAVAFSTRARGA